MPRPMILLALVLSGVCALTAWGDERRFEFEDHGQSLYYGEVSIDPESGSLAANWTIEPADLGGGTLTYFLRDTINDVEVQGRGVASTSVGALEGMEGFTAIEVALDPDEAHPLIKIRYEGVLIPEPMDNRINGIEPGRIELNVDSFWFPIDSRFNQLLSADVTLRVPGAGWQAVTTGRAESVEGGFRLMNEDPRLDIAVTLSKNFHVTEAEGFTLYDQREDHEGVDRLASTAAFCRAYLNQHFGQKDPLPASRLLITTRSSSGYARENYIVFTDISDSKPGSLTRFVCHEFAHYWARGGAWDTVENWINESFAEYLGTMAVREQQGQEAYDSLLSQMQTQIEGEDLPPIWVPGATARGPYLVNYRKGPLALARLEERAGQTDFMKFSQKLLAQDVKTTPGLLDILQDETSREVREWFESVLAE